MISSKGRILISFLILVILVGHSSGQDQRVSDQIRNHKNGIAVWWLGQASWIIKSEDLIISTDLFLKKVDVLFFSPTEHNMYIDNTVILINSLEPEYIFPQHHRTVALNETNHFWAKGYPDEVKIRLSKPLKERYFILKTGEMKEIR